MRNKDKQKIYFFSDKLRKQLEQISHHPLTIVEAPSGFGKTTAVREYLKENLPQDTGEYWYTCLGEPSSTAWRGICSLIANADKNKAEVLKSLEMPTIETLIYMTEIIKDIRCSKETYLVIDNYQLISCDIPYELLSVLSMHGSRSLHIIIITQQIRANRLLTFHNVDIHTIHASAFFFSREGVASLFRMEGLRLTELELEQVYIGTEGWVSAIRLQIINYQENGTFERNFGIEQLVENAIWNRLEPLEKELLLSVSVMDSFTAQQAAIMLDRETLPESLEDMLKNNDFIRYYPDKNIYTIHSILQDYLKNRFYHNQSEEFKRRVFGLAGQSYAIQAQYYPAAQLFYKIGDYDAILSAPFTWEYLSNQKEKKILEFIVELVEKCPEDTLRRYPFALLSFCYQLYLGGYREAYRKLCRLVETAAGEQADFNPGEIRRIRGELAMVWALDAYNDINKMHQFHEAAWDILKEPTSQRYEGPMTFGSASVLYMFHRKAGNLEGELKDMDEYLPCYNRLTRGHGAGADSVMRAEALLMRGKDNEAEILCYKALYDAQNNQQISISICAELVLARMAIMRGSTDNYLTAIQNIQDYAAKSPLLYVLRMVDYSISLLNLVLGIRDNVAAWLYDMENIKKVLYTPAVPFARLLYSKLLLLDKRHNELYGITQAFLEEAGSFPYIIPQIFHYIFLAIADYRHKNDSKAGEHLMDALALALPDKIYLPFAQQGEEIVAMLEMVRYRAHDKESMDALLALCRRQERGASVIRKSLVINKSPLTIREREVAVLARDRLSAREIADKLYISEATVRTILKNIYSKLDIHSKQELNLVEI